MEMPPERHVSVRAEVTICGCGRRARTCATIRLPLQLDRIAPPEIVRGDKSSERRLRRLSGSQLYREIATELRRLGCAQVTGRDQNSTALWRRIGGAARLLP